MKAVWSRQGEAEHAAAILDPALVPMPSPGSTGDASHLAGLLRELIRILEGERAFLFALSDPRDHPREIGGCLGSIDLDGDPVAGADRKVESRLLLETADGRQPIFRPLCGSSDESGRRSSLLSIPVLSRGEALAVLVVENRFQDLSITDDKLESVFLYSRFLAFDIDLRRVVKENEGLWQDLSRLREAGPADSQGPVVRAATKASRADQRKGLRGDYSMIVGSSPKMLEIFQVIDRISSSNAPVLINGDSGTGKELIALAVHQNSPRRGKSFVSENCAALTETLLESELFGYVRGAFTGASRDHKGLFEVADGGSLFLDEVGDMSPSMQKKLLRVVQEGVIRRVGGKDFTPVDVRLISATNKDLMTECRRGSFREDLFYRLNVINLTLPPLRERREDIPDLVDSFLAHLAEESGITKRIEPAAVQRLIQHAWPGNVRELENEVKRLFALSDGETITIQDLSEHIRANDSSETRPGEWPCELTHMSLREATELLEREMIRNALSETRGNKSLVAKTLQIPKTSLYNKINKYNL
ncbi:MAG: sigma-54-dependent Fis family transcriptional regulator [Planctomycetes bacterium]|nr:sigma-54-dependent Fis family transcriptional regulator [Planctomycetota bacterium]